MKKIDIAYLKKNLDLKKFLKLISKKNDIEENFLIYLDFIEACSTKNLNYDQLLNKVDYEGTSLRYSIADKFVNGKFFPFISKNFKVLKLHKIYGPAEGGEFYFIQLISSKMDKKYYIAGYRGRDSINDSYCIIKNFKNKIKAYDFFETFRIKKEDQFERLYW